MITPNGLLSVKLLDGKQNSLKYIEIIKNIVIPIGKLNVGDNLIYQQDNFPIHASRDKRHFIENNGIILLNWPAYSPDLNIIENVWSILSKIVYKNGFPKNVKLLKKRIMEATMEINETKRECIINLYSSIRKRLCEVI